MVAVYIVLKRVKKKLLGPHRQPVFITA